MNLEKLKIIILKELKEPSFRWRQAQDLIYKNLISNWQEASSFPKELRESLNKNFPLEIKAEIFLNKDRLSAKGLIALNSRESLETALMIHRQGRNTVCLSSQLGCPLACKFCASGESFSRNLKAEEIILQVLFWSRYLKSKNLGRVTNLVFMGMGEPFLNYEEVFKAINFFNQSDFFKISARKISISTAGLVEGIRKLAQEKEAINLAISLHFVDDRLRSKMMPIARKYPLQKIFQAIEYYLTYQQRQIMFEYMLIKGLNDSPSDAQKLANLMKHPLFMVNIIKYNQVPGKNLEAPSKEVIKKFINILRRNKVKVIERYRYNDNIAGACGQLSLKTNNYVKKQKRISSKKTS